MHKQPPEHMPRRSEHRQQQQRRQRQPLKPQQLAALVGAADPTNPALVLIVAFCAKNVQNGNRAAQEFLLDWSELTEHKDESAYC